MQYLHILDWFFFERIEAIVKHWLLNLYEAEWHWYRFEYVAIRGAIHCLGAAKSKSDPSWCNLSPGQY